jgi:hypothetical protein
MIASVAATKWTMFPGREFDASVWRTHAETGDGARQAMADRLLARGTLIGLRREEVIARLGVPPATEYFTDWDLVYWLGPERGFMGIDSEWLVVRLGSDHRVSDARLVTD